MHGRGKTTAIAPKFVECVGHITIADRAELGIDGRLNLIYNTTPDGKLVRAVMADSFRPPKAGEWYLSGCIPAAYRAPNDLTDSYHIMRLVLIEKKVTTTYRIV